MSSKTYWEEEAFTGVFDDNIELSPLAGANKAYVIYCSSDGHMGDAASTSVLPWHFRGRRIVRAVFQHLQNHQGLGKSPKPQILVYGGHSAGARGAMVSLDFYRQMLSKQGVQVVGLLDSPYWLDQEALHGTKVTSFANQMQQAMANFNITSPETITSICGKVYGFDTYPCVFAQYRFEFMSTPFLIFSD